MRTLKASKSSVIKQAWYNKKTSLLSVEFKNGTGHLYLGVPQPVFDRFQKAKSKGRFFTKNIRNNFLSQRDVFRAANSIG